MANIRIIENELIVLINSETRTLSGIITSDGTPVQRQVKVFRNADTFEHISTLSDEITGEWECEVNANDNDKFRVIVVGESGEYSQVFEGVTAG